MLVDMTNVTIGITGVSRELQISVEESASDVRDRLREASEQATTLSLEDKKGRTYLIPSNHIGYLITSEDTPRRVGFTVDKL